MKEKKTLVLTEGNIFKGILFFVLPIIAGSLIQQLYTTADAVIVGQFVGKNGLAAIDSVHTLFKFPINFMNGLAAGATILISGYFGAKNIKSLDCSVRTALLVAIILGILATIAGVVFSPQLLDIMSVPKDIYPMTLSYCRFYFAGIWGMILYNMASGILRAFGDSKRPLYVLVVCSIINISGDFLLVGVFNMGVSGAAIATMVAQIVSAFLTLIFVQNTFKDRGEGKKTIWGWHFCQVHMKKMLVTGFPLALQSMLFPIANSIVQASVNTMGTDSIAAWGICDKLDMLIWLVADAMAPAMTTYTAQNIGAGRKDRVVKGAVIGAAMSAVCVLLISVVLFFGTGYMGYWFVSAKDAVTIVPMAAYYMKMLGPFFVFYSFGESFSGACCGMGDTVKPMIATLLCTCLLRVVCIWFVLPMYNSMECIAVIYIASWIVTGLAFIGMFLSKKKKLLAEC
ncbi:putative efflux protein, MATE family [Acetitomaculum ruminis DSM 5522]|uniref:Putative efflux protein, MATE family n=1 Tax=Acetitomaculum ruminis DSM 5522 TaxID=1120918 RepID=A0A1I0ZP91_9FIRM|nr:MATE family efflux transporter [Acetitomaculum ruminis]SFB27301.1 putative efflux protein, MATE family [Acetitomaculum ruminis DSM 5522]